MKKYNFSNNNILILFMTDNNTIPLINRLLDKESPESIDSVYNTAKAIRRAIKESTVNILLSIKTSSKVEFIFSSPRSKSTISSSSILFNGNTVSASIILYIYKLIFKKLEQTYININGFAKLHY